VSYLDYDNPSSTTPITEDIKLVATTGGITREYIDRINGKSYLYFTLPITILATNYGEFANQEQISIGVSSILEGGSVKMFPIEPIEWSWGVGVDTGSAQLLNDITLSSLTKSEKIRHVPKSKAYAFSAVVQIDFNTPILRKIFRDSYKNNPASATEVWTITRQFMVYDGGYEIDTDLTDSKAKLYLTMNKPLSEVSKGEKYIFILGFEPKFNETS
jgi:hypothetical protein